MPSAAENAYLQGLRTTLGDIDLQWQPSAEGYTNRRAVVTRLGTNKQEASSFECGEFNEPHVVVNTDGFPVDMPVEKGIILSSSVKHEP